MGLGNIRHFIQTGISKKKRQYNSRCSVKMRKHNQAIRTMINFSARDRIGKNKVKEILSIHEDIRIRKRFTRNLII